MNDNRSLKPGWLRRLDRLIGDLNVLLAAFALCLAVLDMIVFVTLIFSDEILDRQDTAISAVHAALASSVGSVTDNR